MHDTAHPHHIYGEQLSSEIEWVCVNHHQLRHLEWSNVHGKGPKKKYGKYHWKYVPNVLTPRSLLPFFEQKRESEITEEMRKLSTAEWWDTLRSLAANRGLHVTPYLVSNESLLPDTLGKDSAAGGGPA